MDLVLVDLQTSLKICLLSNIKNIIINIKELIQSKSLD